MAAAHEFGRARQIAKDMWLFSLIGLRLPEFPAAMAEAEAALALTRVTGSAAFLHQATLTLHRVRQSLLQIPTRDTPVLLERVDWLLARAFEIHGEMSKSDVPSDPIYATITRAGLLVDEFRKVTDDKAIDARWLAEMAIEDSMSAVAYAARSHLPSVPDSIAEKMLEAGVTDPAEQIRAAMEVIQVFALRYLDTAGGALQADHIFAALDPDRITSENWLLAVRRLCSLSPSPHHDRRLAIALCVNATALAALGDEPSLETAEALLAEAGSALDQLGDEGELRAELLLRQCWVRHCRREARAAHRRSEGS